MEYGLLFGGSVRLRTGELDHLGPLLCLVRDELAEVGGRKRKHRAAQFGDPRLQLRIDEFYLLARDSSILPKASAQALAICRWGSVVPGRVA